MLPNLIIIGAQKCGTTSLHHYLSLHPEIVMSAHKELNFFNENLNWKKGVKWYESHFTGAAKIYGESSPNYTQYPLERGVPERIHTLIPQAKFIYLVRDPIDRMVSQYLDRVKGGQETRPIDEALTHVADNLYICASKYYMQIEQYLRYYDKKNILIVTAEALKDNRLAVLQKSFQFLGVDDAFTCDAFAELKNVSAETLKRKKSKRIVRYMLSDAPSAMAIKKVLSPLIPAGIKQRLVAKTQSGERIERPVLTSDLRQRLVNYLKDDVNHLREFTGYPLVQWCL